MSNQSDVSWATDHPASEESEVQAVSFIVRIWRQPEPSNLECRGWVEHVQSGKRILFRGLDQLSSIIAKQVGIVNRRRGWLDGMMSRLAGFTNRFTQGKNGK